MTVVIAMLRGVNLGPHHRIKMEELRALCATLKFRDAQTYVQSGNVVFHTDQRDCAKLQKLFEAAFERKFGFRSEVICRTTAELQKVIAKNPFASRAHIDPAKLLVTFLSADPDQEAVRKIRAMQLDPEELFVEGREVFVYFPKGMGRSK